MSARAGWWWRVGLAAAVFLAILYYLIRHESVLRQMADTWSVALLIWVVALTLLQNLTQFLTLPVLLRPFGLKLRAIETMRIGAWTALLGAVGPLQMGTAYKAAYLNVAMKVRAANIAGLLLVQNVLRLVVCVIGGVAALGALQGEFILHRANVMRAFSTHWPWILVLVVLTGIVAAWVALRMRKSKRLDAFAGDFVAGLRQLLARPGGLASITALHLLQLAFNAGIFYLLLEAAGYSTSLWLLAGYVCLKYLANLVVLLPFNLGISELLTGLLAVALGAPIGLGVAIAFQVRIINLLLLVLLAAATIRVTYRSGAEKHQTS